MTAPPTTRRVFVVGASGGVGRRLTDLLRQSGHDVTGLYHSADSADAIRDAGGTPVSGDLAGDSVETLAGLLCDHDAVVFSAGAGGGAGQTSTTVDQNGAEKIVDAAVSAGVRRFVIVSVFMDAWRGDESPGAGFEQYIQAKRAADVHLAATDLNWLIVRPGTLADDPGTGRVAAGSALTYDKIPREDVAAFIAGSIFSPGLNRTIVELTQGDREIGHVIEALAPRSWTP